MKNVGKVKNIVIIGLLLTVLMFSSGVTLAYLLDKTSPVVSKFVPYQYSTNDLVISKLIEHSLEEGYVIPDNIEFEFQIDLGIYYANQSIITSQGEFKTDEKGIFNIKIKPNVDVVISGIEEGTKVKVTEIIDKPGFSAKDELVKEVTISSTESSKIKFINIYKPLLVNGQNITLNGKKVLDGREWQDGDNFTFKLEYFDDNKWVILDEKTILYSSDNIDFNKYDFNKIINDFEFKKIGIYKFRLSEVLGNLENVDYDKTINNFEVVITDETMDGKLEIDEIKVYQNITINKENEIYNIEVTFNNTYVVEENEVDYVDEEEESVLINENIIIKNPEYVVETVLSKFEGLSNNYTYAIYDKNDKIQDTNVLRTGDYIKIVNNDVEYKYNIVVSGDVSGDGEISYLDYVKVYNHIQKVKNPESTKNELFDEYLLAADMSGEGNISYLDYVKIYNKIKELKGETK